MSGLSLAASQCGALLACSNAMTIDHAPVFADTFGLHLGYSINNKAQLIKQSPKYNPASRRAGPSMQSIIMAPRDIRTHTPEYICIYFIRLPDVTKPPCFAQVFRMFPTIAEHAFTWTAAVFLAETLAFRSGCAALVQPATEHGFFFSPPCLEQHEDPELECALLVQPANLHVPRAPCLSRTLRARARGRYST